MKSIIAILVATLLGSAAAKQACGICYDAGQKVISTTCVNGLLSNCVADCSQTQVENDEQVCCVRVPIPKARVLVLLIDL